jgi:tRNA pseudouridine55 synthase
MDGVLVVDKAAGMTSHDVVQRMRRIAGERSIGHLGTLDPMATGVLPLVIGRMTRLAQFYTHSEKGYEGTIRFGFATDTYDAAGDPASERVEANVTLEEVREVAKLLVGEIEQMPPPFSAKKIAGVPAYKLARKKQPVELKPVKVTVHELEITGINQEYVSFRARVSSGTYLRSIAHELGKKLGPGAHLASLRRTWLAEFTLNEAFTLEHVERQEYRQRPITNIMLNTENGLSFVHPRLVLPHFPAVTATEDALPRLLHGNAVNLPEFSNARLVRVFRGQTELIAIAQRIAGTLFQPKVVLAATARL